MDEANDEANDSGDGVTVAPYGSWASPFKIDRLTDRVVFLTEPHAAGEIRYWLEGRPVDALFLVLAEYRCRTSRQWRGHST